MPFRDSEAVAARERIDRAVLATLLDAVAAFVARYVVMTTHQLVAVTLWIAHTHALDAFDVTPILTATSPERRSGKTRLLDLLALLVARAWRAIEPSEAVVYRKIDRDQPTLLLDEVDAIFGRKREATEGLRALLNAGNARGTMVPRCVGPSQSLAEFSVFSAKALAGIGALPDTIADRAIPVAMQRKLRSERAERFRRRHAHEAADALRDQLAAWGETAIAPLQLALDQVAQLADDGQPLAALDDRAFEAWEPLLSVAALADERWLKLTIAAALALSAGRDSEPESNGLRLLADVRAVFDAEQTDRLTSQELATALAADADSPWADWFGRSVTPRAIARLLRPFGITPRTIRLDDGSTPKGYRREQFTNAWKRYAPAVGAPDPPQPPQPSSDAGLSSIDDPPQDPFVADSENGANPHEHSDVAAVADESAETLACGHGEQWQARDEQWRCTTCTPPLFPGEVIGMRATHDADNTSAGRST
jgi:hypothetical protein